jgi:hypothetical protein
MTRLSGFLREEQSSDKEGNGYDETANDLSHD